MTILVTGGGGFLGGAIVHRLNESGETVRVLLAVINGISRGGIERIRGDLAEIDDVRRAVDGCEPCIT